MWILIMVVTFALSLGASGYLKSVYARASKVQTAAGLTGAQGLTYVAAFIATLLQFLYHASMLAGRRN
jgi:Zn-dependent membrane protease YugP